MRNMLKSYTILYVEDELSIQKNLMEYLTSYFKEVFVASDGEEGLEKYFLHAPDALLLDINLPNMDGLTLAKTIRKVDKNVSIIMLTAFTDQDKLLQATELKLLKYLVKPIDLILLKETLDLLAKELSETTNSSVSLGDGYIWDFVKEQLQYNGEIIPLSTKEHILLMLFIQKRHTCVSFQDIMAHVWADDFDKEVSINSVKNIVSDLRKKLSKNSIQNIYGTGYLLK